MKEQPLVTVYITNFNYGRYIKTAIESVLSQSLDNFEIIIIDDGSTDGSSEIIDSYESNENIRIIYQQNKGLNITNNIAIRVARGKYIMRLDADDYLDQNALLVMSNKLESDPELGLVFPNYFNIDAEGNIINVEKRNDFNDVSLLDQPAHGACTMIRRQFLLNLGGYDEDFRCQDGYELWVKFIKKYKVANIDTPLFYYRQHGSNLTSNENRILGTRQDIKKKFIEKNNIKAFKVLAIIPVRGDMMNNKSLVFNKLSGKTYLDKKINTCLDSELIEKVVVTTPSEEIEKYIKKKYNSNKKVFFHKRSKKLARLNSGLVETVENVLETPELKKEKFDVVTINSIEFPFVTSKEIEDTIHTLSIFEADSVISVRPENSVFFHHHGQGMEPVLNLEKFSKLEREILYKYTGGIITVKTDSFKHEKKLMAGKVGHTVINQKSAFMVQSVFDLKLAEAINNID